MDAKAVEQVLIEEFRLLKFRSVINNIKSINIKNPIYEEALNRSFEIGGRYV